MQILRIYICTLVTTTTKYNKNQPLYNFKIVLHNCNNYLFFIFILNTLELYLTNAYPGMTYVYVGHYYGHSKLYDM